MSTFTIIHVVPSVGGGWAVQADDSPPSSIHPSRGLAIAKAWELVESQPAVEVIVHEEDGAIHSNLLIRRHDTGSKDEDLFDPAEDDALRREAMRITPGRAELQALIGRSTAPPIDYSAEVEELPC